MASRKDYEAIAKVIQHSTPQNQIAKELAEYFKKENPNFSRDKFVHACGFADAERL